MNNIRRAFSKYSESEAERLYHKTWLHFGMVAAELSRLPRMKLSDFRVHVENDTTEFLQEIFSRGKGAIFASGHIGNWEWLGAMIAAEGFPFTFVVEQQSNQMVGDWMDRMREREGIEIHSRGSATKGTLQALKRNQMVAMLSDQDAGNAGVFVPFFGKLASTPRGPALFNFKTGAPIIFGSCCREEGKFKLRLEEIVPPPTSGDRTEDERIIMAIVTARLEADIRQHPDQYMWLHRRWKTAPPTVSADQK